MLKLEGVIDSLSKGIITELEAKVLDYVLDDYVNHMGMPSEFKRTSKETEITFNRLKGVVGSLVKKDLIYVENYKSGWTDQWIHSTEKGLNIVGLTHSDLS